MSSQTIKIAYADTGNGVTSKQKTKNSTLKEMKTYGLIGFPLTHSFSQRYFSEKFAKEGIANCQYQLFELPDLKDLPALVGNTQGLCGLNVTIPHKQNVLAYLDELDPVAAQIGAVNVIKVLANGKLKGYNSDYYGFKLSLEKMLRASNSFADFGCEQPQTQLQPQQTQPLQQTSPLPSLRAFILGNGGAAQAVKAALNTLQIDYQVVSQKNTTESIGYEEVSNLMSSHHLVINTTPLGMYPNLATAPLLPYCQFTPQHFAFDLVYNPEQTLFMQQAAQQGATVKNGLEMLYLQAEKAWEIWQ